MVLLKPKCLATNKIGELEVDIDHLGYKIALDNIRAHP
jgi:hypothetical protein